MSSESVSSSSSSTGSNGQSVGLIRNRRTSMEARAEHQHRRNYKTLFIISSALSAAIIVMTISWLVRFRDGFGGFSDPKTGFNWHPMLMMVGMILLLGKTILTFRTDGQHFKKKILKIIHVSLNTISFVLGVIGLVAVFRSHDYAKPTPIPHLYSFHSWLGLLTMICFGFQFLIGFVAYMYPGLPKSLRQSLLPVHRGSGLAIFLLALIAAMTGLTEKTLWSLKDDYKSLPNEGILVNFLALFTAFYGVLIVYLVTCPDFKREAQPEDEVALTTNQ